MTMTASIYGRLGRDPKPIQTNSGTPMCVSSVAVTLAGRDSESTLWVELMTFGRQAEALERHAKGDMVGATGRMQMNHWTDGDGNARESLQLVADAIHSSRTVRPGGGRKQQPQQQAPDYQAPGPEADFDDPISF